MSDSSLQAEFSYVGLDWSKKSKGVQAIWRTFVSQWINNADQNVPTLLGLMVTPVNSPGQSTPVTSLQVEIGPIKGHPQETLFFHPRDCPSKRTYDDLEV